MRTLEIVSEEGFVKIIFDGHPAKASWTKEAETELKIFHPAIDIAKELSMAIISALDYQFEMTDEEKTAALQVLKDHFAKESDNAT